MKEKAAVCRIFLFFLFVLTDIFFALKALSDVREAILIQGVNASATARFYKGSRILSLRVTDLTTNEQTVFQSKFGFVSLRWRLQEIPQPGDHIAFYTLKNSFYINENQFLGLAINERCSTLKLWFDTFGSYLNSGISIVMTTVGFAVWVVFEKCFKTAKATDRISFWLMVYLFAKILSGVLYFDFRVAAKTSSTNALNSDKTELPSQNNPSAKLFCFCDSLKLQQM